MDVRLPPLRKLDCFNRLSDSTERDNFENFNQHSLETSDSSSYLNELNLPVCIAQNVDQIN